MGISSQPMGRTDIGTFKSRRFPFHTMYLLALTLTSMWLGGCQNVSVGDVGTGPLGEVTQAPIPTAVSVSPRVAYPGQVLTLHLKGVSTRFDEGVQIRLGPDVVVGPPLVLSATEVDVPVSVHPSAPLGWQELDVISGGETLSLGEGLLIQQGSFSLDPPAADRGQTLDVTVTVSGVELEEGYTWMGFGEGVSTVSFTPLDETHARARIVITSDAPVGPRDVTVENGPERVLSPGAFTVDRGVVAITFEPGEVYQGQLDVPFVVTGYGTHFEPGQTHLDLGLGLLIDEEDPTRYIVESPTRITGLMTVCRAAAVGYHEVTVGTTTDTGVEIVRALNGFEVVEVPVSEDEVRASFYLGLYRTVRDGVEITDVSAFASFSVYPGACGESNGNFCSAQPLPFDQPVFYPPAGCTPTPNTTPFPPPPNVDAGEHIWFEIPGGPSIRLVREEDGDGTFFYAPEFAVPLDDFWFNAAYNIRSSGGTEDVAIPAFTLEKAILTPPADFRVVQPDLSYAPTLGPWDAIPVQWVDLAGQPGAHTFPVAFFYATLRTTDAISGAASEVRVVPFDDGNFTFPADLVSQLYPGPGRLLLSASRLGPPLFLPGALYSSTASTGVAWEGLFELRAP